MDTLTAPTDRFPSFRVFPVHPLDRDGHRRMRCTTCRTHWYRPVSDLATVVALHRCGSATLLDSLAVA